MKEQLELILAHLLKKKESNEFIGLCHAMIHLKVTNETFLHVKCNRPTQELHPQFFDKVYYDNNYDKEYNITPAFYWSLKDIDSRIAFIQYLITLQDERTT